ncbi:MAG: site-specific integrase, partial [Rhodospirillales bacterium]
MSAKTKSRKGETQKAPFSRHVEIFLEMMAAERGASANTIEAYNRDLYNFGLFMQRRREKIENADTKRIKQYLSKLYAEGRAATTRARHLSVLRQFFAFLFSEGPNKYDPTRHISSPKMGRMLPEILNKQEVERLLSAAQNQEGPNNFLLTTLMEILYATGLRVSELLSLRTDAI